MASETIFSVTASLVLWEGVYEFTPHYRCNKHTLASVMVGERSAFSRRSAQLLNGDRKLFCTIRQQRAAAALSLASCCVCFASIFCGQIKCLQHAKADFLFPPLRQSRSFAYGPACACACVRFPVQRCDAEPSERRPPSAICREAAG